MRKSLFCAALLVGIAGAANFSTVSSWAYWLQDPDLDALAASPHDLVVIDYSSTGGADGEFTPSEIAALQDDGKCVMAYFSIGEAESYRFYWQTGWRVGKPGWIVESNPDYPDNFKVKFWNKNWWNLCLEPYLDRILDAGYDGVFLDLVESYWWWHEERGVSVRRSANRMVKLVEKIALYARARDPDFKVIVQNAESIIDDCSNSLRTRYMAAIDGVCSENLFYDYWTLADQAYRLDKLAEYEAEGMLLLVVDYIDPADHADFFQAIADSGLDLLGYPANSDRELADLVDYTTE
jgi:cysteinyl-tRNA synthetase